MTRSRTTGVFEALEPAERILVLPSDDAVTAPEAPTRRCYWRVPMADALSRADAAADLRAHLPADSGDFTERMNADLAFHERLVQLSENATLLTLWKGLEDRMRIIFFAGDGPEGSPLMTYAQHEPIVDAIASGDLRAAHDTLLAHMEEAAHRWAAQPLSAAPID